MAMDSAAAITAIQTALATNMTASDTATGQTALATAIVTAVVAMLGTAQVTVAAGLTGPTGPVTGTIPAGSIT